MSLHSGCFINSSAIFDIKKSILAGFSICVGGIVYLSCAAKGIVWFGAVLFSAGLFTIYAAFDSCGNAHIPTSPLPPASK